MGCFNLFQPLKPFEQVSVIIDILAQLQNLMPATHERYGSITHGKPGS